MDWIGWLVETFRGSKSISQQAGTQAAPILIKRNNRPFYEERGWRLKNKNLHGYYRTRSGAYEGRIQNPFSKNPTYFVKKPPKALLQGEHGACFSEKEKNVFSVHFNPKPKDVNTGIRTIEWAILEALS